MEYFLIFFMIMNIGIPVIQNIQWQHTEELVRFLNLFQIKTFTGFPGYYFYTYDILKHMKNIIYVVGICAFPVSIYLTHMHEGNYFINEGNFSVINFSTAVLFFVFFKEKISKVNWKQWQIQCTKQLSSLSLGIYLIHAAILGYVNEIIKVLEIASLWKIVSVFGITLGISMGLCAMLRNIPFVKKFV